ncbi:lysophospholipid acyltransferase family protein [Leptolyngbya sp. AN02str]|uniref:lysophospholipid acyltransferase family protein n=1 Tax=Leptolyngbya sp. AN02str TaxID=3423363 RepID=UPI003D30F27A
MMVNSRVSPAMAAIAYFLGNRILLPSFFGHIRVTGQENLPHEGAVILAPTHRSRWDGLIIPHITGPSVTGRYLRFMVTADEMTGLQGWLLRRLGGFPVNIRQPGISSLRYGMELLQNGEMLVIFPEGGIFRDGDLHPLKPGLARLAIQAEQSQPELSVKIVPIHLEYSKALPTWGDDVTARIGEPIAVANYLESSAKQGARRLTEDLHQRLLEMGKKPSSPRVACRSEHGSLNQTVLDHAVLEPMELDVFEQPMVRQ